MGSSIRSYEPPSPGSDSSDAAAAARAELKHTISETTERLGLVDRPRANPEIDSALESRIEIAKLKEMLSGQEQATLRALGSSRDFQSQLKDAMGEVARLQTQLKIALAAADTARVSPPDSQFAQSQLLRMQKDLQRERAARQSEAEQSADRIAKLETALADATKELTHRNAPALLPKMQLVAVAAALAVGVLSGGATFWYFSRGRTVETMAQSVPDAPSSGAPTSTAGDGSSTTVHRSARWTPAKDNPVAAKGQPEFTRSVDRLTHALGAFPGQDPQAVLLQVSLKRSTAQKRVCSFDWRDGQPALVFGKGKSGGDSLSSAITECAEAVEQFR